MIQIRQEEGNSAESTALATAAEVSRPPAKWGQFVRDIVVVVQCQPELFEVVLTLPDAKIRTTRDFYQFDQDDPDGFSILVTPESLELRLPTIEWTLGYMGPRGCSRLLERVPYPQESMTRDTILALVQWAKDARRAEVRPCFHCGRLTEPGHAHNLDGDWVCHGCSEHYRGIVH